VEINREFIHCLHQLDRQRCFAIYLPRSFHRIVAVQELTDICHATKIRVIELQTPKEAIDELILYFELPNGIFKDYSTKPYK